MSKKLPKYIPSQIEGKWQKEWEQAELYTFKLDTTKEKYYNLVEFPYPSGNLHLGHWFAFIPPDVNARFRRMDGKNVFFTNGFDAFGLPAENAAIKNGVHPQEWTMQNIETMTKQFATMGTMVDWSHKVITCLPEYYGWNQWIFIKMFEKGLAYRGKAYTNWCPVDQTVLANENIENGKCWRCGTEVVQKEVEQWFLKITDYAEKLLWPDKPTIDWPISVQVAQNQWIGRKEGVKIKHQIVDSNIHFESFSAYPAWSWADTFIVMAPEHPLAKQLTKGTDREKEVNDFIEETGKITTSDRNEERYEKKGVFTGRYAKDPFGGEDMPIWLANFALMNFGTGIIRCSGHDPRDVEFATKYGIETKEVVDRIDSKTPVNAHTNKGILKNSGPFSGKDVGKVIPEVIEWIEKESIGTRYVNYHIRDWSISRQRYWGTPVPMIHCEKDGIVPVNDADLPIKLPLDVDFTPHGEPPLASSKDFINTTCPKCGGKARRDADTLDTFFDSAWYYYRYVDPQYTDGPLDKELVKKLMPVDIYFGGSEHTLGHTLYARFFTKFFKDLGLIAFDEFAKKRVQHGVVLGPDGNRMSKSKGNVVNPDDVVKEYGADTVRLYLCFMMPYDAVAPWDPGAIQGIYRFLRRIWDMFEKVEEGELSDEDLYQMHTTIKKVGDDIQNIKFNTAVAGLMEWLNHLGRKNTVTMSEYVTLLLLLAPFAPHFAEEIYQQLDVNTDNNKKDEKKPFNSIHLENWPLYEEKHLLSSETVIVIQVNGKKRGEIKIAQSKLNNEEKIKSQAQETVKSSLDGKEVKKVVYVPGKILNFVV